MPRARYDGDTSWCRELGGDRAGRRSTCATRAPAGTATSRPSTWTLAQQTQDRLAVSASMRTALLVYSGITVKMMVDSDLGAVLSTMFMVQYEPNGLAGAHDHPFEETYLILEGAVEASFDDATYVLEPGDVAWAGVGCVHGFRNVGDGPVRWLETQAPQPPGRHSYRFVRDWDYLRRSAAKETADEHRGDRRDLRDRAGGGPAAGGRGDEVVLTGRDADRAAEVAASVGGAARHRRRPQRDPRARRRAGRRRRGGPARGRRHRARPEHGRRLRHRPGDCGWWCSSWSATRR